MKGETITETNWRLSNQAKQSKDNSTQFRYLSNKENRVITKKD